MDYKEKYEMALEGIQEILGSGEDSIKMSRLQQRLQGIFPELKESEDEKIRQFLIHEVTETSDEIMSYRNMNKKDVLAWLEKQGEKGTNGNDREIPNSAWNEEDEMMIKFALTHFRLEGATEDSDIIKWLKSLKPQPKQEWSGEGRSKIQRICKYLNEAKKYYADITEVRECIDWLKSLRPQNRWKPSDEQIIALRWVLNNVPYCKHKEEISGLLDQIKDL